MISSKQGPLRNFLKDVLQEISLTPSNSDICVERDHMFELESIPLLIAAKASLFNDCVKFTKSIINTKSLDNANLALEWTAHHLHHQLTFLASLNISSVDEQIARALWGPGQDDKLQERWDGCGREQYGPVLLFAQKLSVRK